MKKTTANDVYYARRSFTYDKVKNRKYIVVMRVNGLEQQMSEEYPLYNTAWQTAHRMNIRQGRIVA